MTALRDLVVLTRRLLIHSIRMPAFVIISIVQPVIWLVLFGPLFGRITALGGFGTEGYADFLVPGLAVMAALFGSAYSGMALLMDHDRGILDRFLVTPAARGALIGAYVAQSGVVVMLQATVIVLVGLCMGAQMSVAGYGVILVAAALLGAGFGALSNALALRIPRHDAIIAVMNFVIMPLVFLSSMIIATKAMPDWIAAVARYNPVDWAVQMARGAALGGDWSLVAQYGAQLALFSAVCILLAVRAFHRFMDKA
ncbi:transport permease protein [Iodidimonas muriae]|uniref:Transport permease protein n=1 Tax=Iodidimonas muriae TaxID=261467 RepID=A0ABQ2LB40_9PROT|nr:ABC transporter permease [Iodidimonas muriae]GGO09036.1 transport permease protein [Iodidimonas muriae]